ncbi:MAG: hypothetical protein IGS39_04815 [Calothrix sp. C42_A2020_038]|nr:hypothetical protein [Calothrix sp. C42_A2020_038]
MPEVSFLGDALRTAIVAIHQLPRSFKINYPFGFANASKTQTDTALRGLTVTSVPNLSTP